jgi:hypothetical protein
MRFRAGILHVVAVILLASQISWLSLKFEADCCKHLDLGCVFPASDSFAFWFFKAVECSRSPGYLFWQGIRNSVYQSLSVTEIIITIIYTIILTETTSVRDTSFRWTVVYWIRQSSHVVNDFIIELRQVGIRCRRRWPSCIYPEIVSCLPRASDSRSRQLFLSNLRTQEVTSSTLARLILRLPN